VRTALGPPEKRSSATSRLSRSDVAAPARCGGA
jgi:hypothetical protein